MKFSRRPLAALACLPLALSLEACKLAHPESDTTAYGLLTANYSIEQWAIDGNPTLRSQLSGIVGSVMATKKDYDFSWLLAPQAGCYYSNPSLYADPTNDLYYVFIGMDLSPSAFFNLVNPGALTLTDATTGSSTEFPASAQSSLLAVGGALDAGSYRLSASQNDAGVTFDQEFVLPGFGSDFHVSSGTSYPDQLLPTPNDPAANDNTYTAKIRRGDAVAISYNAPPHTDYVRVRIRDNKTSKGDITCFTDPANSGIGIAASAFAAFSPSTDASLYVDFVNVQSATGKRLNASYGVSYVRHVHGLIRNGGNVVHRFGVLEIE